MAGFETGPVPVPLTPARVTAYRLRGESDPIRVDVPLTMRVRTAGVTIDWKKTSFGVLFDKPLIAQRDPDSLAQVGVSPLTSAGNLWLWQPQARLERRAAIGANAGLKAQFSMYQTSEGGAGVANQALIGTAPQQGEPHVVRDLVSRIAHRDARAFAREAQNPRVEHDLDQMPIAQRFDRATRAGVWRKPSRTSRW